MAATEISGRSDPSGTGIARRALAYAVHAFTASGAVLGVLALLAIMRSDFAMATVYLLIALAIDSMDGSFARLVGVTTYAPRIDGRRMDDIVDYLNFVVVPAVFMVQAGSVTSPALAALPVLSSAFGFARRDAKTADDFFLGWPSYWNVLAIYLWLLGLSPEAGTAWVIGLSIAIFVPWKYIYPSRLESVFLRWFVSVTGMVWSVAIAFAALRPELAAEYAVVPISLAYPALYVGLSLWLGGWAKD